MDISFYAIWTLKQRKKPVCKIDFHFNRKPFYGNFSTEIYSYIGTISIKQCTMASKIQQKNEKVVAVVGWPNLLRAWAPLTSHIT